MAAIAGWLLMGSPAAAHAQLFFATRPQPEFRVGPLFVRADITPALGDVAVNVLFSVAVPPTRSAAELEQDLFLLWPGAVGGDPALGAPEPALSRFVEKQGFDVIDEGRLPLTAQHLYQVTGEGEMGGGRSIQIAGARLTSRSCGHPASSRPEV